MNTLPVTRENAIKAYQQADESGKALLKTLFGGSIFHTDMAAWEAYIIPLVNSFEAACKITGDDPGDDEINSGTVDEIAYKQMKIFTQALNPPDWNPEYTSGNQRKWGVYWQYIPGTGFRFNVSYYVITISNSTGGSRLCFASEKLAVYAAKHPPFVEIYNRFLQ